MHIKGLKPHTHKTVRATMATARATAAAASEAEAQQHCPRSLRAAAARSTLLFIAPFLHPSLRFLPTPRKDFHSDVFVCLP